MSRTGRRDAGDEFGVGERFGEIVVRAEPDVDRRFLGSCDFGSPNPSGDFDYDYVGILWLNDFTWQGDGWRVHPDAVEEWGIKDLVTAARRERRSNQTGPLTSELLDRVAQTYRILFTRALKGVYVWVPDPDTHAHLMSSLGEANMLSRPST